MAGTSFSTIDKFPPKLNILVIDTDPEALELIEKKCKEKSHQVVKCSESSRAVDVLLKKEIDIHLILMELHMPMMNGFAFLQFLNKEEFDIPFVMMSMDFTWFSMTKAFQLGAMEYFMKPLDERLDLLQPFLRHYCARRNNLKDDETSDEEAKVDDILDKKDDILDKKDDTLDKKDDTLDKKDGTLV
ncbi:hypothetical protein V8G54_000477 [Vigna mungo]|uniref:Response regulatory domain-containing protein n=1 Tax=Vigna mungo TaxID=3915 RepID=A0AAQ3SA04_VIGMU